jgi:hypothetical protein
MSMSEDWVSFGVNDGKPQDALKLKTQTLAGGILKLKLYRSPVLFKSIWSLAPHIVLINGHTYLANIESL